jgi:ATP-dependent phosphofructokinase / diphosphate-dependent phosphofructokinase
VAVRDNQPVQKGDLLFEIDPEDFQAQVDVDEGQVQNAEANLKEQSQNLQRQTELYHNRSLPSPISVLEVLGRNAGWVSAATALARSHPDDAPHLIYFPEKPVSLDRIAADAEQVYRRLGRVSMVVCEGQLDEKGTAFGADVDRPASAVHRLASNLGHTLARLLSAKLNLRARAEKPGLFGRCCGPLASELDRREARECGRAAARAAHNGESRVMIAIRRESMNPYRGTTFLTPLESVAGQERLLPGEWINSAGNDVTSDFLAYASPLVPPVQPYAHL